MNKAHNPIKYQKHRKLSVNDPVAALHKQAESGVYAYLLAYADDGVIWGKWDGEKLALASDEQGLPGALPRLRASTLWEARLFGENTEYLVWRDGQAWHARQVSDGDGKPVEYQDESLILWGTEADGEPRGGFYPVREAEMGIRHAPPLELKKRHSLRLVVRHYLEDDEAGAVYVKISRLVDLSNGE
mgnify:CR=1 FL=1